MDHEDSQNDENHEDDAEQRAVRRKSLIDCHERPEGAIWLLWPRGRGRFGECGGVGVTWDGLGRGGYPSSPEKVPLGRHFWVNIPV